MTVKYLGHGHELDVNDKKREHEYGQESRKKQEGTQEEHGETEEGQEAGKWQDVRE
jgi:hypothetical protein